MNFLKITIKSLVIFLKTLAIFSEVTSLAVPDCRIIHDKYDLARPYMRNFLHGRNTRWPNGKVPYVFGETPSDLERKVVSSAIKEIHLKTCIRWHKRHQETQYVNITFSLKGCFATLGYSKYRRSHALNLQRNDGVTSCLFKGTAIHEMLHSLGYDHEQNRPDRDGYIQIHWRNIQPNKIFNFWKSQYANDTVQRLLCSQVTFQWAYDYCYSGYKSDLFGLPYDYQSIMHYRRYAFSKNQYPTLKAINSTIIFGTTGKLTALDIRKIQAAYDNCNAIPTTQGPCIDGNSDCKHWKTHCVEAHIRKLCKISCGVCNPSTNVVSTKSVPITTTTQITTAPSRITATRLRPCYDREDGCRHWKSYCGISHILQMCPQSCRCNSCDCLLI